MSGNQSSQEKRKINLSSMGGWVIGIILLIIGISKISEGRFAGLWLLIAAAIVLPPINKIIREKSKNKLSKGVEALIVIILVIIGFSFSLSNQPKVVSTSSNENPTSTQEAQSSSQPTTTQKSSAANETKPAPKTVTPTPETSKTKTYQQVFTFSGDGVKKSEPFIITGSRFKIKYDCSGDLCQAFLYKAKGSLSDLIMNTAGSIKDESIFYGAGEYYIDANTMGSYTMIVEDYR